MMDKRAAGVLMSVTSLPSPHGIGDFGDGAFRFVDLLKKMGVSLWQILPLNPVGYGHSPYQPYSSYAMDEQFISLDKLTAKGLLPKVPSFDEKSTVVRYEEVRAYKLGYLRKAYEAEMKKNPHCLDSFIQENPWVADWGVFSMFHRKYPMSWSEWPAEVKGWIKNRPELSKELRNDADFEIWLQKVAYEQWAEVHVYANQNGISIIGDIPFYVGFDSCDVWTSQKNFLLDEVTLEPTFIAGVPPDYFSAVGQRWGNPIYDWDYLKKTDFAFIVQRIVLNAKIYDIIRLDHFRAFDTFWKIPSSCPTAVEGKWIEAPGYALFDTLFKRDPSLQKKIIAEDLGDLRPEVLKLRDHYLFPGMNVIEFTFHDCEIGHKGDWNLENSVCYLGTHDNDTMKSYFYLLSESEQGLWINALNKLGIKEGSAVERLTSYCLRKPAKWAILSMQDILELDGYARTNVPSTVDSRNWTFKLADFVEFERRIPRLASKIAKYGRQA